MRLALLLSGAECEGPRRPPYVLGCGRLESVVKSGKNTLSYKNISLLILLGDSPVSPQNIYSIQNKQYTHSTHKTRQTRHILGKIH